MFDCHCHLADDQFVEDLDEVIMRAKEADVDGVVVCAAYADQFNYIMQIRDTYPNYCFPCIGIHPVQRMNRCVRLENIVDLKNFLTKYRSKNVIAGIGEVGLDFTTKYHFSREKKNHQIAVFENQIKLAKDFDLTLNVHSRNAYRETLEILLKWAPPRVLMHAFRGGPELTQIGIDAGFYFSVPPHFALGDNGKKFVERVPLTQLCLETDSPSLALDKNKRNEPAEINVSLNFIARIKKIPVDIVAKQTTENSRKVFPILKDVRRWVS